MNYSITEIQIQNWRNTTKRSADIQMTGLPKHKWLWIIGDFWIMGDFWVMGDFWIRDDFLWVTFELRVTFELWVTFEL